MDGNETISDDLRETAMTPENPTTEQVRLELIKQSFIELVLELEVVKVVKEEKV